MSLDPQLGPDSAQTKGLLRDEDEGETYTTKVINDKTQVGDLWGSSWGRCLITIQRWAFET